MELNSGQEERFFLFTRMLRPALGTTQPSMQWVPGCFPQGVKWPEHETDHSPPRNAEIKMHGSTSPVPHISSWHSA
jgi:hypothetical protein